MIEILDNILGIGVDVGKSNRIYFCPFCQHYKRKLSVEKTTGKWHCWVCNAGGYTAFSLLRKSGASKTQLDLLKLQHPNTHEFKLISQKDISEYVLSLPPEFIPLKLGGKGWFYETAMKYLNGRGISYDDIVRYNIGYCDSGKYDSCIIIPNYNSNGVLNYFIARSFSKLSRGSFKAPNVSKNIIGFELQTDVSQPVILTESATDAITIQTNAIPLYGKYISKRLAVLLSKKAKEIIICLDPDATRESIDIIEKYVYQGKDVYYTELPDNKDPNELGYNLVWNYINNAKKVDENKIFKWKTLMKLK